MSALVNLLGPSLRKGKEMVPTDSVLEAKKSVLLYFSAHWCGPCRGFTPLLAKAYTEYIEKELELVFVSSDSSDVEFEEYFGEMPWLALPYDSPARSSLGENFGVQGIPDLVLLDSDGHRLQADSDLRGIVAQHGSGAFPLSPDSIAAAEAAMQAKASAAATQMVNGSIAEEITVNGGTVSLSSLLDDSDHVMLLLSDGDAGDDTYHKLGQIVTAVNEASSVVPTVSAGALDLVLGAAPLVAPDGESTVSLTEAVKNAPLVALYFSAHWCGPCRSFTPQLVAFVENLSADSVHLPVIFGSSDRDSKGFDEYFATMPWFAFPHADPRINALKSKYSVSGIPWLVVLNAATGELVANEADVDVPSGTRVYHKWLATAQAQMAQAASHRALSVQTAAKTPLGLVHVGWSLYNKHSSHAATVAQLPAGTSSVQSVSEDLRAAITATAAGQASAPNAIVLSRRPALCDRNGQCTEGDVTVVCSSLQAVMEHGEEAYPWSAAKITEAKAAATARKDALRESMMDLGALRHLDGMRRPGGEIESVGAILNRLPANASSVLGIYFSAHWCPPCRHFTPLLADVYRELQAEGKPFEVIFVSSDRDEASFDKYADSMPWAALPYTQHQLKADLSSIYNVSGIPTLVLLSHDGTLLTTNGREAVSLGAKFFPWDGASRQRGEAEAEASAAEAREAAAVAEAAVVAAQQEAGVFALKRLSGAVGSATVTAGAAIAAGKAPSWTNAVHVSFESFSTVGIPEAIVSRGVLYYEASVTCTDGIPQVGFATSRFKVGIDDYTGDGVGDDDESWAVDGGRGMLWAVGPIRWEGASPWAAGDVIGMAANLETGEIATSYNGSWTSAGCGVVFTNDAIKGGVYPALSGAGYSLTIALRKESLKYDAPPTDVWSALHPQKPPTFIESVFSTKVEYEAWRTEQQIQQGGGAAAAVA